MPKLPAVSVLMPQLSDLHAQTQTHKSIEPEVDHDYNGPSCGSVMKREPLACHCAGGAPTGLIAKISRKRQHARAGKSNLLIFDRHVAK